ncbi:MAG: hypothetical protein J5486_00060 [Bacteroidaceae bacterium]|nr:hypothetical protein [Bacteroidaceae bacterium]
MNIPKLNQQLMAAADIPAALDAAHVAWQQLECSNWSHDYPYKPAVSFRLAHTGAAIAIHFDVEETSIRAEAAADNGAVWEDSCCELFFQPDANSGYYNIECNCGGTMLMGYGLGRHDRQRATLETLALIGRWTTLGRSQHPLSEGSFRWQLALLIPTTTLFQHHIPQLDGIHARCNIYKCGDKLPRPHFLSWQPVGTPNPDFHRPEFFGECLFE